MARYFRLPFANSGDKDTIPDETANSIISYATGYSQDYQRNPTDDPLARRPERNFFNQLQFDITDTLRLYYETGVPPFITSADNNGIPFSYSIGARVLLSNRIYENTIANNTTTPPATSWVLVDVAGSDARYLLESNNLSDLTNVATARTNLSISSTSEADNRYLLESNNLSDLTNPVTARTNLELGTSATRAVGTSSSNVMEVGAFGLGSIPATIANLNIDLSGGVNQFLNFSSSTLNSPSLSGTVLASARGSNSGDSPAQTQIALDGDNRIWTRVLTANVWSGWQELAPAAGTIKSLRLLIANINLGGTSLFIPDNSIGMNVNLGYRFGQASNQVFQGPDSSFILAASSHNGGQSNLSRNIQFPVFFYRNATRTVRRTGGSSCVIQSWIFAD